MGDLRDWWPESNGAVIDERPVSLLSSSSSSSNPSPASIGSERWQTAEQATQGIISQVQPTVVSEERRRSVIDYVQRLIRSYVGCEVFPFGSVPLKTYLPDGDIDLTAFGVPNVVDALSHDVSLVLEGEERNSEAEFVVKDVQVINAEVKLVKCLVQNIVVDISFNQLGGLCTLCFLEQVDRLIGKDHLFKRSIILTKAWCYYESRILGAHHGLISTYALETLVLYIFHLFHSSLNGPLEVLYRFLDYFSKFDWDNYCISVNGPVRISSLPEIVAEDPDNGGLDLLLSNEFLRECVDVFSVPSRGHEINSRTFLQKHLNIVDPLKENNNLGRSISKGNSYRIRSAFTYGARKLGRILLLAEENIGDELRKFLMNTLDRHGSGQRPDVQDPLPMSGLKVYNPAMTTETNQEDKRVTPLISEEIAGKIGESRVDSEELLPNGEVDVRMPEAKMKVGRGTANECHKYPTESYLSAGTSEADSLAKGTAVSGSRLSGDAKDLATSRFSTLRIADDLPRFTTSGEGSITPSKAHHAPHLYFSHSSPVNAMVSNGNADQKHAESLDGVKKKISPGISQVPVDNKGVLISCDLEENHVERGELPGPAGPVDCPPSLSSFARFSKDFYPSHLETGPGAGNPESLKAISDLSGEYDAHLLSLQYGQWCYECALTGPIPTMPLPQFQNKNSWNPIRRLPQFRRGAYSHVNANGVVPRPAFFPVNPPVIPGSAFGMEEIPKPRGTGTYFPNTNHQLNRPRMPSARIRNHVPVRSPRNGRGVAAFEANLLDRSSHEVSQAQFSVPQVSTGFGSSDNKLSGSPGKELPSPNGLLLPNDKLVEFGSFGQLPLGSPQVGSSRNLNSPVMQNSSLSPSRQGMPRTKAVVATNEDRVTIQSYRLKDEDDFPPLSA